jgi:hypothetical protein
MEKLPTELLPVIFKSKWDPNSCKEFVSFVLGCRLVNKSWKKSAESKFIWQGVCESLFGYLVKVDPFYFFKTNIQTLYTVSIVLETIQKMQQFEIETRGSFEFREYSHVPLSAPPKAEIWEQLVQKKCFTFSFIEFYRKTQGLKADYGYRNSQFMNCEELLSIIEDRPWPRAAEWKSSMQQTKLFPGYIQFIYTAWDSCPPEWYLYCIKDGSICDESLNVKYPTFLKAITSSQFWKHLGFMPSKIASEMLEELNNRPPSSNHEIESMINEQMLHKSEGHYLC